MIKDAHNVLHDVQSSGRAKELLAQVCDIMPFVHVVNDRSNCRIQTGVSIKADYRRSTATCRTSYRRLVGFH